MSLGDPLHVDVPMCSADLPAHSKEWKGSHLLKTEWFSSFFMMKYDMQTEEDTKCMFAI